MFKSVWGYTLFALLTLSGCGSDSDAPSDLDNDGTVDASDCAPQNEKKWQFKSYQSKDSDLDGKFAEAEGNVCVGEQLPAQYAQNKVITGESDCDDNNNQIWVFRAYNSLDKDFDSKYTHLSGEICSGEALPDGYLATFIGEDKLDCNDDDKDIWRSSVAYLDLDKDGYGTGEQQNTCYGSSLPTRLSLVPGDCDDTNPQAWAVRTYQARDNDSDGVFVADEGGLCAGNALPKGFLSALPNEPVDCNDNNTAIFLSLSYSAADMDLDGFQVTAIGTECTGGSLSSIYQSTFDSSKAQDCNDSNSQRWRSVGAFEDADGDGFGTGIEANYCIGEQLPNNISINSSDCNDSNSAIFTSLNYQAVDMDLDSFQLRATGSKCTGGSLSEEFKATFDSSKLADCDDTDNQAWRSVVAFSDTDSDGYGAGESANYCIGQTLQEKLSLNSTDCNDTNSAVFENLNYLATDMDLDGYQLSVAGTECTGGALSEIYQDTFDSSKVTDCNDDDESSWRDVLVYPDTDLDSFGALSGEIQVCIGDQAPAGNVFNSTDCNDNNASIWRADLAYDDIDGDRVGAGPQHSYCTNAQPAANTSYLSYDCDDNDISVFRKVTVYADTDGDGVGAGKGRITCMGNSYLEGDISIFGYDPEPDNSAVSNFDLPPVILLTP